MAKYSGSKSTRQISANASSEIRRAVRNLGEENVRKQLGVDKRQLENWKQGKGFVNRNDVKRIGQLDKQTTRFINFKDKFDENKIRLLQQQRDLRESRGKVIFYEPPKTVKEAHKLLDDFAKLQSKSHRNKEDNKTIIRILLRLGENPHAPHTYKNGQRIRGR